MKNYLQIKSESLHPLSEMELVSINGGATFWEWAGWVVGATVGSLVAIGRFSAEYQASLPPNLKK